MAETAVRTPWTGWVVFASVMLFIAGVLDVLLGLVAVVGPNSAYFVDTDGDLLLLDVTGWGWWHLLSGAALIVIALFVGQGATWARIVATVLVALNAVGQVALLPVQPWWSLVMLAVDVIVIYAITVHGRELSTARAG